MLKALVWALVIGASVASCGSDSSATTTSDADKTGDVESSSSCEPNSTLACYCSDGKKSGKQTCSAAGVLRECDCPAAMQSSKSALALCPDLASQAGCMATPYLSQQLPSSMLFVLDRSRSMVCNLPPLQDSAACERMPAPADGKMPTKWTVVRDALTAAFGALPDGPEVGLNYFSDDNMCGVDSTPAVELGPLDDAQRGAMTDSLNATTPGGETPIVGAVILAYAHLHQEIHAPGNRFVVLLTDGAESCAPDNVTQLLDTEVEKARDANIRTFVIGAPGSEPARALLSELAYRGGTATDPSCKHDINGDPSVGDCHLDMTKSSDFASALTAALGTVSSAAQGCEFAVPSGSDVSSEQEVNVQYTPGAGGSPQCFLYDKRDCDAQANGWQFVVGSDGNADYTKVKLCGAACGAIKKDPSARVDILVGCSNLMFQ